VFLVKEKVKHRKKKSHNKKCNEDSCTLFSFLLLFEIRGYIDSHHRRRHRNLPEALVPRRSGQPHVEALVDGQADVRDTCRVAGTDRQLRPRVLRGQHGFLFFSMLSDWGVGGRLSWQLFGRIWLVVGGWWLLICHFLL